MQRSVQALTAELQAAHDRVRALELDRVDAGELELVQRRADESVAAAKAEYEKRLERSRLAEHTKAHQQATREYSRMTAQSQEELQSVTRNKNEEVATLREKLESQTDRLLSKEAELKEVTDERDILRLRVHTMTVELDAAQADVVVSQLRRDFAAAEEERRLARAEASVATATLARATERGDKATEEVDELKAELAREQARRAADLKSHAAEVEAKTEEWLSASRKLQSDVDEARSRLNAVQDDYKREAHVADIVNVRSKDAMSKLAADNLQLRRELGVLSYRMGTAGGLAQKRGDAHFFDGVAIDPADANFQVDHYVAAGAVSEYEYLTAGVKVKGSNGEVRGIDGGNGGAGGVRPSTTGGTPTANTNASLHHVAGTRGGGWVVPGPSPGTAGTTTGPGGGGPNSARTAGTGKLAHSAHWRQYDAGRPVGGSARSLMEPTQALGYSAQAVYARAGYRPGTGEGSAGHMAATATLEGRRLGGICPNNVRERVEAAGALRDMIDGYQVTIINNASAAIDHFVAAGGYGGGGGVPTPGAGAVKYGGHGRPPTTAERALSGKASGSSFGPRPNSRSLASPGSRQGGGSSGSLKYVPPVRGAGGGGAKGGSVTRLPAPGKPDDRRVDWGPRSIAQSGV